MEFMFVTLDVSRVSGWLNADANCRVERRTYEKHGEARAGRWEGVGATAAQAVCRERPDYRWSAGHARSAP